MSAMSAVTRSWKTQKATHKVFILPCPGHLHLCQALRILQVLESSGRSSASKQMSRCFWPAAAARI